MRSFLTNRVVNSSRTDTVLAVGIDICQTRTVTAAANCLGPVDPSTLAILPPLAGPAISLPAFANGQFPLSFPTENGTSYTVQFKNDLSDPVWTDLQTLVGNGGNLPVMDAEAAQHQARYYRILAKP